MYISKFKTKLFKRISKFYRNKDKMANILSKFTEQIS